MVILQFGLQIIDKLPNLEFALGWTDSLYIKPSPPQPVVISTEWAKALSWHHKLKVQFTVEISTTTITATRKRNLSLKQQDLFHRGGKWILFKMAPTIGWICVSVKGAE